MQADFDPRCVEEPLLPCISQCPLRTFCAGANAAVGLNKQTHGQVIADHMSGDPVKGFLADQVIRSWRAGMRRFAGQNGYDPLTQCPR